MADPSWTKSMSRLRWPGQHYRYVQCWRRPPRHLEEPYFEPPSVYGAMRHGLERDVSSGAAYGSRMAHEDFWLVRYDRGPRAGSMFRVGVGFILEVRRA